MKRRLLSMIEISEDDMQINDNEYIKVLCEDLDGIILVIESGQYEFEVVKNL